MVADQRLFVWDMPGAGPVCVAGLARELPRGFVVGPVYTPPQRRKQVLHDS